MIFYLIIILKVIGLIIFTYYVLLTKSLTYLNDNIFNTSIDEKMLKLTTLNNTLNNILGISIAVICVIVFNPFYIIEYKINSKFKNMLYYYGMVVIYDIIFYYLTTNHISHPLLRHDYRVI